MSLKMSFSLPYQEECSVSFTVILVALLSFAELKYYHLFFPYTRSFSFLLSVFALVVLQTRCENILHPGMRNFHISHRITPHAQECSKHFPAPYLTSSAQHCEVGKAGFMVLLQKRRKPFHGIAVELSRGN